MINTNLGYKIALVSLTIYPHAALESLTVTAPRPTPKALADGCPLKLQRYPVWLRFLPDLEINSLAINSRIPYPNWYHNPNFLLKTAK